jgi:hypothetical protein
MTELALILARISREGAGATHHAVCRLHYKNSEAGRMGRGEESRVKSLPRTP